VSKRTDSGLSVGATRVPSNKKRTLVDDLPDRSQKASMSFFNCVVRLILKKISLFESVTLMFRCSLSPPSARGAAAPFGEPLSDILLCVLWSEVKTVVGSEKVAATLR
jgi:hypothetical protein